MGTWQFRWNFDKPYYSPGEEMSYSLWIDNKDQTYLHVSEFVLALDFGNYALQTVSGMIAPGQTMYVGNMKPSLPNEAVGRKLFSFSYTMQEYVNNAWLNLG